MQATLVSTATQTVAQIVDGIREKKGFDITILDLRHLQNTITDYLVVCSGNSDTQTGAIASSVEDELRKTGERPWRTEGKQRGEWILLDYVNVVVHIFIPRIRTYYNLEDLWGDARITNYTE